jgi:hypothetical protein
MDWIRDRARHDRDYDVRATPVPVVGIMAALPVVAAGVVAAASARAREVLLALPLPLLVGVNIMRSVGVFFLMLAAEGRLGGPFPQSAGWGDIVVGLTAIPLTMMVARRAPGYRGALLAWNILGTLDLVSVVTLGIISAPGSPLQLLGGSVGSTAVWTLPWSNMPTLLVPFYLLTHGVIFANLLRSERRAAA